MLSSYTLILVLLRLTPHLYFITQENFLSFKFQWNVSILFFLSFNVMSTSFFVSKSLRRMFLPLHLKYSGPQLQVKSNFWQLINLLPKFLSLSYHVEISNRINRIPAKNFEVNFDPNAILSANDEVNTKGSSIVTAAYKWDDFRKFSFH